jgi:stearoyl-CoA desaturase (delta-9 desaturase)
VIHVLIVVLVAVALTEISAIATSIYLHRTLAHRALRMHPALDVLFRTDLWMTTGQNRREWVAVHRKHHTFTDRPGDPHSPRLVGFWRVQIGNVYYYVKEAKNPETLAKFAPDIAEDFLDRWVFSRTWTGLVAAAALLAVGLGLWTGLITMLVHGVLYVFVLAPLINGLAHWHGAQNFPNTAYNWRVVSWFTGGESLHNNHHAHPRAPKFSVGRWEFDPSWLVIRALVASRLIVVLGATVRLP